MESCDIIIPTLNAENCLGGTIRNLVGFWGNIIVVDGGSSDCTIKVAREAGATVVTSSQGRGVQLQKGAEEATSNWFLFLHGDTRLEAGWTQLVEDFISCSNNQEKAGVFLFALDDSSGGARRVEKFARLRGKIFGLHYGDQGLLISRKFFASIGGYKSMNLMEDVDIMRRIGKKRVKILGARAYTSSVRYRSGGWWLRPLRNLLCLVLYLLGIPPRIIEKFYT